jgi:hypothetical protein
MKSVMDVEYWRRVEQIIRICKPIVDAIGNLEAREVNLADCMLEPSWSCFAAPST